jgi:hypothetical protein
VLQIEDRKMLEEKGYKTGKKNHSNQVRPESADYNDTADSQNESKNE